MNAFKVFIKGFGRNEGFTEISTGIVVFDDVVGNVQDRLVRPVVDMQVDDFAFVGMIDHEVGLTATKGVDGLVNITNQG